MPNFLRPQGITPPSTGPVYVNYWVKLFEEATLPALQLAVNEYMVLVAVTPGGITADLVDTQYAFISPRPPALDSHVMKCTFMTMGHATFTVPV
jgi:hypothetical protein